MNLSIKKLNFLITGTILLSLLLQCISLYLFSDEIHNFVLFSLLWLPLFICLYLGKVARNRLWQSLTTINIRWVLVGFITGLTLLGLEQITLILWKLGDFNAAQYTIHTFERMIEPDGVKLLFGSQPQTYWYFTANLILTLVFTSVFFTIVFISGFELVWRGVVLPELMLLFGVKKLPIIIGIILSICFIPFNLSGGINPDSPYLTAFIYFPLLCIGINYILVFLCLNRKSIWPSSFALGTYLVGSESMLILASDAESNLIAKGILIGFSVLWVRSFLNDANEELLIQQNDLEIEEKINI